MLVTPAQTSGTCSGRTKTPSRLAIIGLVDSPPPTQTSKPGAPSGPITPTNETSLISCAVHCEPQPEIVVLYLRGRFTNSGLSAATASVARSAAVASRTSPASRPATG